jgi:hypothetical protein
MHKHQLLVLALNSHETESSFLPVKEREFVVAERSKRIEELHRVRYKHVYLQRGEYAEL